MAAASATEALTPMIADLPDGLLGAVLARLGRDRARSLLLVSKRWHRVFMSEPALWRQCSVHRSTAAADMALLRRVGSLAASLDMGHHVSEEQQAEALACAQPARLRELVVFSPQSQLAAALRSYSRLRELRIFQTYQNRPLPAGLEAAISQLTELQTLVLRGKEMPQDLLAAVLGSTQLKERSLCADSYEQPQALLELTCLRQLTSLSLSLRSNDPHASISAPQPALFTALELFEFVFGGASELDDAGVQVAGCVMERCSYNAQINLPDEGTALVLTIEKPRFAGSIAGLPALLSVLHPGSVPVVERLSLIQCSIGAGVLGHCSALAAVTHLQLQVCDATAGNWEAALAAVFEQAPLLSGLNLYGILPCQLPQSVVNHSGLRQLALMWFGNEVSLPEGAYLASLEQLWLTYGAPPQLPPALAAATALTSLVLRGTQAPLSTDGMAALLSQLPLLRRLQLTNCSLKQLPLDGWAGMTAMQHLDLSENRLTSLPAMLYETPSLLQLDLSDNRQLARTAEQLGALLSSLPLLEVLDLSTTSLKTLPSQPPPGLQILDVADNALQSLPSGLTSPSLEKLHVQGNKRVCLTAADVDSLLALMPSLRTLGLERTATPEDVKLQAERSLRLRRD